MAARAGAESLMAWNNATLARPIGVDIARAGSVAGTLHHRGYLDIKIDRKKHRAHRLAWLYMTGEWPDVTDHINGNKIDNRIKNLRSTTQEQNAKNTKVRSNTRFGILGVSWRKDINKYSACISSNGVWVKLGHYQSFFDACCARKSAELKNGYHENHGRSI